MRPTLPQTITYWAPASEDRFGGKTYSAPIPLRGRWEDRAEQLRDDKGQPIVSKSRVYVDTPVLPAGYLKQGEDTAVDPTQVEGAEEIRVIASVPDLRNLSRLHVAYI